MPHSWEMDCTIGLLVALALVMYATRNIDWFAIGLPPARPAGRQVEQRAG